MVQQIEITLKPKRRGFHLVTSEIVSQLPKLPKTGIVTIFTKHTSCGVWTYVGGCRRYACSCQIDTEWCQHHHPHHRWPFESWHLAGHLLLRVPQLWWFQGVGSDNHRRIRIWKIRNLNKVADFFTVLEQESPQVALGVRTYQVSHAHG